MGGFNKGDGNFFRNQHAVNARLARKCIAIDLCADKSVLYIGKANGRGGLRQRVRQYIKYGWGAAANHKGGRAVWQVENFPILLLDYEVCEDCEQREHELLAAFKRENGVYPLANWRG